MSKARPLASSRGMARVSNRSREALRSIRTLAAPGTVRGMQVVALLLLLERVLTPATAWLVLQGGLPQKVGVTLALALIFGLRSHAQRYYASLGEAQMFERIVSALIKGDVFRASVLPGRDARSEVAEAVFHAAVGLAQDLPTLLADCVASLLLSAVLLAVEPLRLVLLAVGLTAVAALVVVWSRNRLQQAIGGAWTAKEAVLLGFVDALEGRLEIVTSGRGPAFLADLRERMRTWSLAGARMASSTLVSGRLPLLGVAAMVAVVIWISSHSWPSLAVTLPDLALFASVTPAFAGVAQGLYGVTRAEESMALVAEAVRWPRRAPTGGLPPPASPNPIVFDAVSFAYDPPSRPSPALSEVTFSWQHGRVLAFAGGNGSGKSTCLRMLLGVAHPTAGAIYVGAVALRDLEPEAWQSKLAFLPQRPYMPVQGSVGSGIRLLAPEADDDKILRALDRVGLLDSLRRFGSEPLAVPIDTLSVGERQRVAIARLLCRDASLFILDEPDANLDRGGITMVTELVGELSKTCRVIFAAHTPELLAVADTVIELERGRVAREASNSSAGDRRMPRKV